MAPTRRQRSTSPEGRRRKRQRQRALNAPELDIFPKNMPTLDDDSTPFQVENTTALWTTISVAAALWDETGVLTPVVAFRRGQVRTMRTPAKVEWNVDEHTGGVLLDANKEPLSVFIPHFFLDSVKDILWPKIAGLIEDSPIEYWAKLRSRDVGEDADQEHFQRLIPTRPLHIAANHAFIAISNKQAELACNILSSAAAQDSVLAEQQESFPSFFNELVVVDASERFSARMALQNSGAGAAPRPGWTLATFWGPGFHNTPVRLPEANVVVNVSSGAAILFRGFLLDLEFAKGARGSASKKRVVVLHHTSATVWSEGRVACVE